MSNIHQTSTGILCLARVLAHFGAKLDEASFLKRHACADRAILWDDLRKTARHYHLRSQLLHATLDELREIPVPAIAKMKSGTYVVIVVNNDEAVYLIDPRLQQPVALAQKQFADAWSGEVLIFSARYSWAYFKKKYNLDWFLRVIGHYKKYLGEVMLAAFFLQLMGIGMPLITQVIIDKVIGNEGWSTLTVIGVSMVIFFLLQALLSGLRTYLLNHTTIKLDAILGTRLFHHLISLPLPYYESRRVGDTLMRVGALNSIREFLTGQALMTILDVLFSVVFIAFMLWYSVPLTLIALIVVPLYIVQNIWAIPIIKRKIEAVWRTGAANNAFMVEAVTNIETIKALAVEPQFNHKWEELLARYVRTTFENVKFRLVIGGFSGMMQTVTSLLILWYGGHLVMDGYFTLGQLIAFQMIAGQAMGPMTQLLTMWPSVQQVGLALERIGDILNTRMEPVMTSFGKRGQRLAGHIELRDVCFRYRLDLPLVLKHINLDIKPGEKIGIVGRSGSGKSTLTNIVQQLYLPETGQVLIDGLDIREANLSWLRQEIGVVMQESYLFDASVRDNIAVGKPDASMDEVIAAARLAGAHDFILELKEGYDTKVGERGAALSGGQRQRIAIARALLTDPPILIFDEATSALDYESERAIMHNMDAIGKSRTMLIIAHRLSTVRRADRIIVVEKGEIIESGSHDELMAKQGAYCHLYQQQEDGLRAQPAAAPLVARPTGSRIRIKENK